MVTVTFQLENERPAKQVLEAISGIGAKNIKFNP